VPQWSYPKDLVCEVLTDVFRCDVREETTGEREDEGVIVVSRVGNLFVGLMYVEQHEVLRESLRVVAEGVVIDFEELLEALDKAVDAALDAPED